MEEDKEWRPVFGRRFRERRAQQQAAGSRAQLMQALAARLAARAGQLDAAGSMAEPPRQQEGGQQQAAAARGQPPEVRSCPSFDCTGVDADLLRIRAWAGHVANAFEPRPMCARSQCSCEHAWHAALDSSVLMATRSPWDRHSSKRAPQRWRPPPRVQRTQRRRRRQR